MTNHTPGPWSVGGNRSELILDAEGDLIAGVSLMKHPNLAEDTRLIAAAPDMLDALKGIVAAHGDNAEDVEGLQDAIKAIRKAEGK